MKAAGQKTLLLATMVLSFSVCVSCAGDKAGAGPGDAEVLDSGEVPDPCTEASPCALTSGVAASDYIAPIGDEDPWQIQVPTGGTVLSVRVSNDVEFSPIRLEVVVFGPTGDALKNARFQGNGKQQIDVQLTLTTPGLHRIVVRDVNSDELDRRNPYFLTVTLLPENDLNEPNNVKANASTLTPGVATSGNIGSQGDHDWFKIDAPRNKLLVIRLSAPSGSSPVRLRYELFNPSGDTRLAESTEPSDGSPFLPENRAIGNLAGIYLIDVIDDPSDGQNADQTRIYTLSVSFVDEPDASDLAAPNETRDTATAVTPGTAITAYIAAKADQDFYRIDVPAASTASPQLIAVEADMASNSPVDLQFSVVRSDGVTLVCDAEEDCKALRFDTDGSVAGPRPPPSTSHVVTAPGAYYVVVRDHQDDDFDASVSYRLLVTLPAEPDLFEGHEIDQTGARLIRSTTSTASALLSFPWVEGYISYAGDQDWFRFDLPGPIGASSVQNGDWLLQLEIEKSGPTPIELETFLFRSANGGSDVSAYGGYGERCRGAGQGGTGDPYVDCYFPDSANATSVSFGESSGDCLVVFREQTEEGPHYIRVTDLNRDDHDVRPGPGRYRIRLTATAKCPTTSVCRGQFVNQIDYCGDRP